MLLLFFVVISIILSQHIELTVEEKDKDMIVMDATNIPWGYDPSHDAFQVMNDYQIEQHYRVLDDTNRPEEHTNHAYIDAVFKNSTLFKELTSSNINDFLWKKKPLFIIALCNCERDLDWGLPTFEKQLGEYENQFVFLYAYPQAIHSYNLIHAFQLNKLPAMVIDNVPMGSMNEKFRILEDVSSWMWKNEEYANRNMMRFLESFLDGSARLVVRSEEAHELPYDTPGDVWELVGNNFKHVVLDDKEHDYLLLVYSPNSPACKSLLPLFHDLAKSLASFETIRIATFDKTVNDFPARGLFLKYYPTVYFFPATRKHESLNFFDFHQFHFTEEGLVRFINKHADHKLDLSKALEIIHNKEKAEYKGDCVLLTKDNFNEVVLSESKTVFVDFYAPWCVYCKMLLPTLEELCTHYKDDDTVAIGKVDCPENNDVCNSNQIRAYPTLKLYNPGRKNAPLQFRGERSFDVIKNFIEANRVKPKPPYPYGQNGHAEKKETPCLLRNGNKWVDLTRISEEKEDDYFFDGEEYQFFLQICKETSRGCVNKDVGASGAIQVKESDPKKHCYILGEVGEMEAKIIEFGDKPVSELYYHGGERADDYSIRNTKITLHCDEVESFEYEGESNESGAITYSFIIHTPFACNIY